MMRQITSVVKLTVPTIGNWATDQITAIASSTQRVSTRLTMKPTAMAETENRKKNEEPRNPNCSGLSCNSVLDRRAGEADHDLVGEIDQHEQEQEKRDFPGAFRRRLHGHGSFPI